MGHVHLAVGGVEHIRRGGDQRRHAARGEIRRHHHRQAVLGDHQRGLLARHKDDPLGLKAHRHAVQLAVDEVDHRHVLQARGVLPQPDVVQIEPAEGVAPAGIQIEGVGVMGQSIERHVLAVDHRHLVAAAVEHHGHVQARHRAHLGGLVAQYDGLHQQRLGVDAHHRVGLGAGHPHVLRAHRWRGEGQRLFGHLGARVGHYAGVGGLTLEDALLSKAGVAAGAVGVIKAVPLPHATRTTHATRATGGAARPKTATRGVHSRLGKAAVLITGHQAHQRQREHQPHHQSTHHGAPLPRIEAPGPPRSRALMGPRLPGRPHPRRSPRAGSDRRSAPATRRRRSSS